MTSDEDAVVEHFRKLAEAMVANDHARVAELMSQPPKGIVAGTGTGRTMPDGSIVIDQVETDKPADF